MKINFFNGLLSKTKETIIRFPLASLAAFLGVIVSILLIELNDRHIEGYDFLYSLLMTYALAFPLFIAIKLFIERKKLDIKYYLLIDLIGIIFLAVYYFLLPDNYSEVPQYHFVRFVLFGVSFLLAVTFAPFIQEIDRKGFWQFNKSLFIRAFFTFIYSGTLFAGLAIAYASLDYLFNVNIEGKVYLETWVIIAGLVATHFFMGGVPRDFDSLSELDDYPIGIKIFTLYILLPLLIIYFCILYAYTGKIVVTNNWPEGMVSYLILVFSAVGISSIFLLYPLVYKKENKWLRIISKTFFFVLVPLIGVLFWAVYIRISNYGLTERRYMVIVIGIWLAFTALYSLINKKINIKILFYSLFIIVLLSSFGPWGAISLSERLQVKRLEKVLIKNEVLVNGKINATEKEIPRADAIEVSSVVSYLHYNHGLNSIQPWFDVKLSDLKGENANECKGECDYYWQRPELVVKAMGLKYLTPYMAREDERKEYMFNTIDFEQSVLDISGYNKLINFDFYCYSDNEPECYTDERGGYITKFINENNQIQAWLSGKIIASINLTEKKEELIDKYLDSSRQLPVDTMTVENSSKDLKLIINHININEEEGIMKIKAIRGIVLLSN